MSHVEADIEALKALREALVTFISQQKEALEAVQSEINITIPMLDESERYWHFQVEERQQYLRGCELEAARAATEGYSIDCSSYVYSLQEAQEQLTRIRHWLQRVDETVYVYHHAKNNFAYLLESDMWQAIYFLDNRIKALEAYNATRISSSFPSSATMMPSKINEEKQDRDDPEQKG